MRNILERVLRLSATLVGLGLFCFCVYQLAFVTRVVTKVDPSIKLVAEEVGVGDVVVEPVDSRPVILVDAGHGGKDGGAVGGGVIEKNLALQIAKRVASLLGSDGRFRVELTRNDDTFVELEDRAKMANDLDVALFVSIHLNTGPSASANGVETWYAWPKPVGVALAEKAKLGLPSGHRFVDERGELLAERVQSAVCEATGARDRGVKNKGHLVTKLVGPPSILVECGFLTNAKEAGLLVQVGYQERVARGVANGVFQFLEEALADPMFGILQPVKPEKERILSQSARAES